MSWETMLRVCLSVGILLMLPPAGFGQQNCEQIRKSCLDHCHYAPQHQWTSGFKCKRECTKQVENCRRGMRGYPPHYSYGDRYGRGYGAAPARGAAYGYGTAPQQPASQAPYSGAAQQPAAPVAGYGQHGYPAYGTQAPYGRRGYAPASGGQYAPPPGEEPYTGP